MPKTGSQERADGTSPTARFLQMSETVNLREFARPDANFCRQTRQNVLNLCSFCGNLWDMPG